MADKKIDISKRKKPPKLNKTAWEELKYAADQVSNTLMFAPDTVESIYKGNIQPLVDRFKKISKTKKDYFNPKKPTSKKITPAQQKSVNQAAPVIKRIVEGDKRKVKLAPKPEKPIVLKKMGGGKVYKYKKGTGNKTIKGNMSGEELVRRCYSNPTKKA